MKKHTGNRKLQKMQRVQILSLFVLASLWGAGSTGAPQAFAQDAGANNPSQDTATQPAGIQSSASPDTVYIIQQKPPFKSARPGFYLALGMGSASLDVSSDDNPADGLIIDEESGGGGYFLLGYAFQEGFALELRMAGYGYDTNRPDIYAGFGQVQIDAVTHFNRRGRVQPYVAGGIGFAAFGVGGDLVDDSVIFGGQVDFGGGVEWMFARHWGLALDYRFAIQRYQEKAIELEDGEGRSFEIDGSGYSNTWALRVAFSF